MNYLRQHQSVQITAVMAVLMLALAGCFKDAGEGKAAPTQRQVNVRDVEQQRTPSITPTSQAILPTFTPQTPTHSKTLIIGGPPAGDEVIEESETTNTPVPSATDVPPDVATVAPPGFGNSGISPTPSRTFTTSPVPGQPTPTALATLDECIYVVQGGDTLFSIARQFDLFPEDFYPINPELQSSPDSLYIGQQIQIPDCIPAGATEDSSSAGAGSSTATAAPSGTQTHTVQNGDTLFSIALRYSVSLSALLSANSLNESSIIYPGQVLIIPGG